MKDIIVLVADKDMEYIIKGLFPRIPRIENLQEFSFDIMVHPYRDPGIYNDADDFLRPFLNNYRYAIVILDFQGSGQEDKTREAIEDIITKKLNRMVLNDKNCVLCIEPELENWIWVNEARIRSAISWENRTSLYEWLDQNGWKTPGEIKPCQPKEAFESALRFCRTPRSSSLYMSIANSASYRDCQDLTFWKMINQLRQWFADRN